jgi:glutamate-1-semialdehyde 2,1-aminomutase
VKTVVVVQARLGSVRLPNKVLMKLGTTPALELLLRRLQLAKKIDSVVVAIPDDATNDPLENFLEVLGVRVFRGSELDVLARFRGAAEMSSADIVVRVTGDCPLVDPDIVDDVVELVLKDKFSYASNIDPPSFPDGMDVEAFPIEILRLADQLAKDPFDREHVTPLIRRELAVKKSNLLSPVNVSTFRLTLDDKSDLDTLDRIVSHFEPRQDFGWLEVVSFCRESGIGQPEIERRNQGAQMSSGQKLWHRAKLVIPGGNMLLSKRPDMFLPGGWPTYYSRASGCHVWDLDGRRLIDMSIMGIGTNILGYGYPAVDEAVHGAIAAGNMSTLNCPDEVLLAEQLVAMHPWSEMVRFARTGGEANAVAVRIARAATGRAKIAVCGYHGWHDWYLAANLTGDDSLSGHLLPGLSPEGVPTDLKGSILTFKYNDLEAVRSLIEQGDLAAVVMEVSRNMGPDPGFLEQIRALTSKHGTVLMFDECTSGFRETLGGLHKKFGIEPDMAMFGKAMGNGYAVTAVVGRRNVMEAAQSTFISSTFWTERIGSVAALATLRAMEGISSWTTITETGAYVKRCWMDLANKYGLALSIGGLDALASFTFESNRAQHYKTLITQEMLKKGYLASTSIYVSVAHKKDLVEGYLEELDKVFALISECEQGRDVMSLLEGPVASTGFTRLN